MTKQNNAAQVAVQAAALPAESAVVWVPCLLIEGQPLPCGIEASYPERLHGAYQTPRQALQAAEKALALRPDAIGISCVREVLEVAA